MNQRSIRRALLVVSRYTWWIWIIAVIVVQLILTSGDRVL